jgi:hypothetical protein
MEPLITGVLIVRLFMVSGEEGNPHSPKRGDGRRVVAEKVITVLNWAKSIFQ